MTKPRNQKMIVANERPAAIDCFPVAGVHVNLRECTVYIKVFGDLYAIPQAMITEFRPKEQLDTHYSDPHRDCIRSGVIPDTEVPQEFYRTVSPNEKFD